MKEKLLPENRLLYLGIVAIVASTSLWLGAELTRRIVGLVPYLGWLGALLIVAGVALEFWKVRQGRQ